MFCGQVETKIQFAVWYIFMLCVFCSAIGPVQKLWEGDKEADNRLPPERPCETTHRVRTVKTSIFQKSQRQEVLAVCITSEWTVNRGESRQGKAYGITWGICDRSRMVG